MLWIKALHIVFMVIWFVGLFYLPRLFAYHSMAEDSAGSECFKIMESKLYYRIMTPGAVFTIVFGVWLWRVYGFAGGWLDAKLVIVSALVLYHLYCGRLLADFKHDRKAKSYSWYGWFNYMPVIFLVAGVILAVVKPF
ncbi:MAG: CopD family protein [Burkholderiales bacterium]